jgi:calcium-dependent protein kinase
MGCKQSSDASGVRNLKSNNTHQLRKGKTICQIRGEVKLRSGLSSLKKSYKFGAQIGAGNYGRVFAAVNRHDPDIQAAIKIIDKKCLDEDDLKALHLEIGIMETLDHPNIVRYMEAYEDSRFIYLVMEKCQGGTLFDSTMTTTKDGHTFTEKETSEIIYKLLSALNHCHMQDIVHRDIKPENIMFDKPGGEIRIVDFGLSIQSNKQLHQMCGTPYFMSPDVLKGSYGTKADIWALGVVLYMMVCGKLPFTGKTRKDVQ